MVQIIKLRYGAYAIIAEQVGCSTEYVRSVVNGRRANRSNKARMIMEIAERLLMHQIETTTNQAQDENSNV